MTWETTTRNAFSEELVYPTTRVSQFYLSFSPCGSTSTSFPPRSFFRKKGHVAWRRTKNVAVQWEVAATLHTLSSPAPLFALNSSWRHSISTGTAYNILPLRKSGRRGKVNITRWNSEPRLLRKPFEILHVCCFCQSDPMCSILMNYPSGLHTHSLSYLYMLRWSATDWFLRQHAGVGWIVSGSRISESYYGQGLAHEY